MKGKFKINNLTFFVNDECNLDCTYCFVNKYNNITLKYSFQIENIIISLLERLEDGEQLNISFLGGEPLLNFKFIKRVILFIKEIKSKYSYIKFLIAPIPTNGTIYNYDMYQFLKDNGIELEFSIDDFLFNKDIYRIYKYENNKELNHIILKNLEKYINIFGIGPYIAIVVTNKNIPYLFNLIKYFIEELNSKYVNISTPMGVNFLTNKKGLKEKFVKEYIKIINYFIEYCIDRNIQIDPIEDILYEMLLGTKNIENISDCSLWKDLYVSYNGYIYTCTLLAGRGDLNVKNHLFGNLKDGIDFVKFEKQFNKMNNFYKNRKIDSFGEKLNIKKMFCIGYGVSKKSADANKELFLLSRKLPFFFLNKISKEKIKKLKIRHLGI